MDSLGPSQFWNVYPFRFGHHDPTVLFIRHAGQLSKVVGWVIFYCDHNSKQLPRLGWFETIVKCDIDERRFVLNYIFWCKQLFVCIASIKFLADIKFLIGLCVYWSLRLSGWSDIDLVHFVFLLFFEKSI
jgi:hypothetical protein